MTNLKIARVILEVKFPHAAIFLDKRGFIADFWRGKNSLSDWQITNNEVNLFNQEQSIYNKVNIDKVSTVMEFPDNTKAFCQNASEFLFFIIKTLEVRKINRIGLRIAQIEERENFLLLMNNIKKALIKTTSGDFESVGATLEDIGINYVIKIGENHGNLSIGPMGKDQLGGIFVSKRIIADLPNVALFVDLDLYRTDPPYNIFTSQGKLNSFLCSAVDDINSVTDKFVQRYGRFE